MDKWNNAIGRNCARKNRVVCRRCIDCCLEAARNGDLAILVRGEDGKLYPETVAYTGEGGAPASARYDYN